jgi:predicted Zn-dependent protease
MALFRTMAAALGFAATLAACGGGGPAPDGPPPQTEAARSASEQRLGDQTHPQILAQYGGAVDGPVADYVESLGRRLSAVTAQPDAPWTFTTLDSPVVNAFALPGGYVYVTRGLIALAGDEAELAGVIGHEIGHVTAAHTARRQTQAGIAQVGVMAAVIGAAVLGADGAVLDALGQGAGAVAQGAVASFSRGQELEADRLGVEYLLRADYDPAAQADFLRAMQAQSELSAQLAGATYDPNRVDFFATHPATAERVRLAEQAAIGAGDSATRNPEAFFGAIDGMIYGDSPEQGFVRGRRFIHPVLRFAFEAAPGFTILNSADRVTMRADGGGASVVFDGGRDPGGSLQRYIADDWAAGLARQARVGRLEFLPLEQVSGLEAAAARMPIATRQGTAMAHMTVIRAPGDRLYRFFGLTGQGDGAAAEGVAATARSFRALSSAEARAVQPLRIAVRRVQAGDTVASLARRMAFDTAAQERFRVLNGLGPGQEPAPGDFVKLVVEG